MTRDGNLTGTAQSHDMKPRFIVIALSLLIGGTCCGQESCASEVTAGIERGSGFEGAGIHIPALSLRLPTIQLPGLVRYRREPRMMIQGAKQPPKAEILDSVAIRRVPSSLEPGFALRIVPKCDECSGRQRPISRNTLASGFRRVVLRHRSRFWTAS